MKNERYLSLADATLIANMAESLLRLADAGSPAGEQLLDLLTMASVLPAGEAPTDCVALNAEVTCRDEAAGSQFTATIVLPADSDPSQGRISLLSPLALGLIGCSRGDTVQVLLPFGRRQYLHIEQIRPQAAAALSQT